MLFALLVNANLYVIIIYFFKMRDLPFFLGCVQHISRKEKNQLILHIDMGIGNCQNCMGAFSMNRTAQLHLGENIRQKMSGQDTDFGTLEGLCYL